MISFHLFFYWTFCIIQSSQYHLITIFFGIIMDFKQITSYLLYTVVIEYKIHDHTHKLCLYSTMTPYNIKNMDMTPYMWWLVLFLSRKKRKRNYQLYCFSLSSLKPLFLFYFFDNKYIFSLYVFSVYFVNLRCCSTFIPKNQLISIFNLDRNPQFKCIQFF